jgi:hypothetical protein
MDPLSVTASVIAILQLTGEVIKYLNDVKDAPKECQQCTIETSNLQNLLINLRYRLEQGQTGDPWFTAVRTPNVEHGPLDQYKQALEQLQSKVDVGSIFIKPQSMHLYLLVFRKPLPLAKNTRIRAMAAKAVDVANE